MQAKRKWEKTPMNEKTGKPILVKTYLKKGDKVLVITGGDKGTTSEVVKVRSTPVASGLSRLTRNITIASCQAEPLAASQAMTCPLTCSSSLQRRAAPLTSCLPFRLG